MLKAFAPAFALVAAVPALWGAPPAAGDQSVTADLDGDGRADRAWVRVVEGDPDRQELVAAIRHYRITARMPLYSRTGVLPLRVVDLDDDGRDEVVVTESAGANTDLFTVWGVRGMRLRTVTTPEGGPLALAEGGGVNAINRYGCEVVDGARHLVTVTGQLVWPSDPMVYEGTRVTYAVHEGVATATSTTPVLGERIDPVYQVDPQACA
ncbi:hypothetical protein [Saccharothrix stipae]